MAQKQRSVTIPSPFGLVLVPVLLILGGLSIPFTAIKLQLNRRRHTKLLSKMRTKDRVVTLSEIEQQANDGGGTLIIEREYPKGRVRHWWTPEDIYTLTPYPLGSPVNPFEDSPFIDGAEWCRARYTDAERGSAALISDASIASLTTRLRGRIHWIEIPMAEH